MNGLTDLQVVALVVLALLAVCGIASYLSALLWANIFAPWYAAKLSVEQAEKQKRAARAAYEAAGRAAVEQIDRLNDPWGSAVHAKAVEKSQSEAWAALNRYHEDLRKRGDAS